MRKFLTATNQKVGGSNPFWRTTFSCGKQAISSEIACFFTFLEFAKICANKIANIKFLRFLCKQRFKHPFSFPDPLAEFASVGLPRNSPRKTIAVFMVANMSDQS